MSSAMSIDFFEQLITRIGCICLKRYVPQTVLKIFFAYAQTYTYDEDEVKVSYTELWSSKSSTQNYTFLKFTISDLSSKIMAKNVLKNHIEKEGLEWKRQSEWLLELVKPANTIHNISQSWRPSLNGEYGVSQRNIP